jgi:glucose-1-phosphate thymidylyltransferase
VRDGTLVPGPSSRKGILLAGGAGTRLHPMTIPVNKQLLPIYDKPLVYYPLSVLMLAGIRDILVVCSPRDVAAFEHLLGDGSRWGVSFSYAVQDQPRGLPEAYTLGSGFLGGSPSMMILGDNLLYGARLSERLRTVSTRLDGATLFAYRVKNPEAFGVVTLDARGNPLDLVEKPPRPPSPWAITGLYLMDGDAPARARDLVPSARGELEMVDLLRSYLDAGMLHAEPLGRGVTWLDTGTPRALLQAAHFVEVLQERQGLQVACPEEIAWTMGYIDDAALHALAQPLGRTEYGQYLLKLLDDGAAADAVPAVA